MNNSMAGRILGSLVVLLYSLAHAPGRVEAHHHDKGDYVTAMRPCSPSLANTATSEGVPACSPPSPLSDCAASPATAMRFEGGGRGHYIVRPTGRFLTRNRDYVVDIDANLRFAGLEACDGSSIGGNWPMAMRLRMTLQDPACQGGICTLPDVTILSPLSCFGRSCRAKVLTTSFIDPILGMQRIPSEFPWTAELLSLSLHDGAGNPVASQGVLFGTANRVGFPGIANAWEARMVRAYAPCDPASADTTTSDGFRACSNPRPLSNCDEDPEGAIEVGQLGKGKLRVKAGKSGDGVLKGRFTGLLDCSGNEFTGSLRVAIVMRITLEDPACAGGWCTTVDTTFEVPMEVSGGTGTLKRVKLTGVPRGSGKLVNAEIIRAEVRDRMGRAVLAGHGFFVRCNPRGGGRVFCYGN